MLKWGKSQTACFRSEKLLIDKTIEIKWHNSNKEWYIEKGYNFTFFYDLLTVNVSELPVGSHLKVDIECDYCKNEFKKEYRQYLKVRNQIIKKDCCEKCTPKKIEESNMLTYGVKNTFEIPEIRKKVNQTFEDKYGGNPNKSKEVIEKRQRTNFERYGVEHYSQTKEYLEKVRESSLKRYGVDHHGKAKEVVDKRKDTIMDKYGVENISQIEDVKTKKRETCMINYGVPIPAMSEIVMQRTRDTNLIKYGTEYSLQNEQVKEKGRKTMYKNGSVRTSKQQLYIHTLIGGELNYPHHTSSLDIAFPEEKIYIEYNGGGHLLRVKFGHFTEQEFKKYEKNRWYALWRKGWKDIRINSLKDLLPSDERLEQMIVYGKQTLLSGRSWIEFDIDISEVATSQYHKPYDFGELRKVVSMNEK